MDSRKPDPVIDYAAPSWRPRPRISLWSWISILAIVALILGWRFANTGATILQWHQEVWVYGLPIAAFVTGAAGMWDSIRHRCGWLSLMVAIFGTVAGFLILALLRALEDFPFQT